MKFVYTYTYFSFLKVHYDSCILTSSALSVDVIARRVGRLLFNLSDVVI